MFPRVGEHMDRETERVLLALEATASRAKRPKRPIPRDEEPPPPTIQLTPSTSSAPVSPSPTLTDRQALPPLPAVMDVLEFEHLHKPLLDACNSSYVLPAAVFEYSGGPAFVTRSSIDVARLVATYDDKFRHMLSEYPNANQELSKCCFFALLVCVCCELSESFLARGPPRGTPMSGSAEALARGVAELTAHVGRTPAAKAADGSRTKGSGEFEELAASARVAHRVMSRAPLGPDIESFLKRVQAVVSGARALRILTRGAMLDSSRLFARTRS